MSDTQYHDDLANVLAAALQRQPDQKLAESWIKTEPITAFGGRTLLQMVAQVRRKWRGASSSNSLR